MMYVWNPQEKNAPCPGGIVWMQQLDFWFFRTKIWTSVSARSAGRVMWVGFWSWCTPFVDVRITTVNEIHFCCFFGKDPRKRSQMCFQHEIWHVYDDTKSNLLAQLSLVVELGQLVDRVMRGSSDVISSTWKTPRFHEVYYWLPYCKCVILHDYSGWGALKVMYLRD